MGGKALQSTVEAKDWSYVRERHGVPLYNNLVSHKVAEVYAPLQVPPSALEALKPLLFLRLEFAEGVVGLHGWTINGSAGLCSPQVGLSLYSESIPLRLSELGNLPEEKAVEIAQDAWRGFSQIIDASTSAPTVTSHMIGFDGQDRVKVWLNPNFGELTTYQPQQIPKVEAQAKLFKGLLGLAQQHTVGQAYSPPMKAFLDSVSQTASPLSFSQDLRSYLRSKKVQSQHLSNEYYQSKLVQQKPVVQNFWDSCPVDETPLRHLQGMQTPTPVSKPPPPSFNRLPVYPSRIVPTSSLQIVNPPTQLSIQSRPYLGEPAVSRPYISHQPISSQRSFGSQNNIMPPQPIRSFVSFQPDNMNRISTSPTSSPERRTGQPILIKSPTSSAINQDTGRQKTLILPAKQAVQLSQSTTQVLRRALGNQVPQPGQDNGSDQPRYTTRVNVPPEFRAHFQQFVKGLK